MDPFGSEISDMINESINTKVYTHKIEQFNLFSNNKLYYINYKLYDINIFKDLAEYIFLKFMKMYLLVSGTLI